MLQCLDVDDASLAGLCCINSALVQRLGVLLEHLIGSLCDCLLSLDSLLCMIVVESQHHLSLPHRDYVHDSGADLLRHDGVGVLHHSDLRRRLQAYCSGELEIVDLLLESCDHVCVVLSSLCILNGTCLSCLCLELRESDCLGLLKSKLAGLDVHRNFLEVEFVLVIQSVELNDVLEELFLMLFEQLNYSVDVCLSCSVLRFESFEVLLCASEDLSEEALLLFAV